MKLHYLHYSLTASAINQADKPAQRNPDWLLGYKPAPEAKQEAVNQLEAAKLPGSYTKLKEQAGLQQISLMDARPSCKPKWLQQ